MNLDKKPLIIAVASGKGGVEKTSLTLNLATLLARAGKKVLVVDGDIGLANADVQLNIHPKHSLADVVMGRVTLSNAITATPQKFNLLAGSAGHSGLVQLPLPQLQLFWDALEGLAQNYDITLADMAAGVSLRVLMLCARASATLLVATPDPSSLTDAYALVKLLWQHQQVNNAQLVVNQATAREAAQVHQKIGTAMENFLQLPAPQLLGNIPVDRIYATAVKNHQLAAEAFPRCAAVEALRGLIEKLPTS